MAPLYERERRTWEPEALHAPSPMPWMPPPHATEKESEQSNDHEGGGVIIIDMNDYTETRI